MYKYIILFIVSNTGIYTPQSNICMFKAGLIKKTVTLYMNLDYLHPYFLSKFWLLTALCYTLAFYKDIHNLITIYRSFITRHTGVGKFIYSVMETHEHEEHSSNALCVAHTLSVNRQKPQISLFFLYMYLGLTI